MARPRGVDRRWGVLAVLAGLLGALLVTAVDSGTRRAATDKRSSDAPAGGLPRTPQADRAAVDGLLPNIQVLPADDVVLDTEGPGRVLRFSSTLANAGVGPLEVVPTPLTRCPEGQRHVSQVVYTDVDGDSRYQRGLDRSRTAVGAGCMLFHRGHDHWHVDASAAYALTPTASEEPLVARDKVSFCLRDSDRLVRGEGARRAYGECARHRPQGISTGWSDLYDNTLDGQTLRLPASLPDGNYCLRLRADPFDLFRESDEDDNTSAVLLRLRGDEVRRPAGSCAA